MKNETEYLNFVDYLYNKVQKYISDSSSENKKVKELLKKIEELR